MSVGTALLGLGGLGAALHIAGSILIVFGQASVKVAHAIVDSTGAPSAWAVPRGHPHHHPPLWRRPDGKWRRQRAGSKAYAVGGWAAFAVGNILRFVAMRFAAQTVLSGLGSLQFVIIPVASRVMLGIRASGSTALGVTVVLLGNALIILYGPSEVTFTLEELRRQWATPAMSTFLVALGGLLCLLQWLHWRLTGAGGAGDGLLQPQVAAVMEGGGAKDGDAAHLSGSSGEFEGGGGGRYLVTAGSGKWAGSPPGGAPSGALAARGEPDAVLVFAGALLFSAVASFVGAWSVLFSKSLTYVVSYMPGSLADWYSWFVLAAFLATAAFWVRQSDRGLRYYPASLIMPLMQAFWMCMSVLEGGIYFDELSGLPSRHLALLMLGLVLALLGAIFMGIAGFIAEKPEHIFKYSAASSELAACDAQGGPPSSSPLAGATATVAIIVEDKQVAATGRLEQLSNPVLRVASHGALRNGFAVGSAAGSEDGEQGLPWWRQQQDGQLHAAPAAEGLPSHPQLPALGLGLGSSGGSPLGRSPPREFEQMQAVCSPTQQLLSRESSDCLGPLRGGGGSSIFERTLAEAGSGGMLRRESVLLDGLSSSGKGGLQRR
ncbi:hypothetical protein ABPG77_011199 [Micractinium sp. CCAP 211/92]